MSYHMGRGFGVVDTTAPANPVCTGFSRYFDPYCWGVAIAGGIDTTPSYSGVVPPPPPLPPGPPVATPDNSNPLILPPASGQGAQATVDTTIAASAANNQQMYQNFFSSLPSGCQSTIMPNWGFCDTTIYWAAGISVVFALIFMAGGRH